jgi:hypothetical protein
MSLVLKIPNIDKLSRFPKREVIIFDIFEMKTINSMGTKKLLLSVSLCK